MPQPHHTAQHQHQHTASSHLATFLFASVFLLALFPGVFVSIFWAPYNALASYLVPTPAPRKSVVCTSPNVCFCADNVVKTLTLPSRSRGCYLITDHILKEVPEIKQYKTGLLNLFIQHTSCALSLNENFDEDVRADMGTALNRIVPEDKKGQGLYRHDAEGSDDMPAHVKSALIGASVTVPITNGRLNTGTWQGIWYLEFRDSKHTRKVVATIQGEKM
ncbi:uncharacterized protein SETTUDRAFT_21609 [Exserohilum turcica Et28A]|uniref:Secondary thiamine-phosphate synthase enzyme n=1 Tax=Exserohilum turcicum (strain 28A) TaxID=671987 RepID=R0K3V8_EXST2|nr:uncharacterized protein SETTUDRAFT_21609 [Exserohilum turcica Et28A]EOA84254.1 hypothetical protein SETTUDRAFT_21609 [Exserohilum turcica Et28A]